MNEKDVARSATQLSRDAKAFARALHNQGLTIEGDPDRDFTDTHQVLLRTERSQGETVADLFEANNVITNPQAFYDDPGFTAASGVRMGTQEMTRYGMKDFRELATIMAEMVKDNGSRPGDAWRETVILFRDRFTEMHYCF